MLCYPSMMYARHLFKSFAFLNIPYLIAGIIPISHRQYYKIICCSDIRNIRKIVKNYASVELFIVAVKVFL